MEITTTPICRVGSQGQTLHYHVKAPGATSVSVPEHATGGLECRVVATKPTADGVEARIDVHVLDSTPY